MMDKQQFMLKKASMEWNASEYFVRVGILKQFRLSSDFKRLRFSQLPERVQNKIAKFAEYALEYSDDWKQYVNKQKLTEVEQ